MSSQFFFFKKRVITVCKQSNDIRKALFQNQVLKYPRIYEQNIEHGTEMVIACSKFIEIPPMRYNNFKLILPPCNLYAVIVDKSPRACSLNACSLNTGHILSLACCTPVNSKFRFRSSLFWESFQISEYFSTDAFFFF